MAKIDASSATIEIIPCKREAPFSNWIDTTIVLEYHILRQSVKFEFANNDISLRIEDFVALLSGARQYIENLPIFHDVLNQPLHESFRFKPLELCFEFNLDSGYYEDVTRQDGKVFVNFSLGLKVLHIDNLRGDEIGCVVEITVHQLVKFLDELEHELEALL